MIYLFLVAVVVLNLGAVVATRGTSTAMEYDELSIFKTFALLELQFTAENEFSTEEIYHIEEVSSLYLNELIINDESLPFLDQLNGIIDVSVNVKTQTVDGNEISLDSEVIVIHYGTTGIIDLAALLTFLVNRNITDSSFVYLDHMIETDSSIELISFEFVSESITIASNITTTSEIEKIIALQSLEKSGNEKTLLIVTTLLSITLFGMSAILIWVGGGWLMLRKKVQDLLLREEELTQHFQQGCIESKPTIETEGDDGEPDNGHPEEDNETNDHDDDSGTMESAPLSMYGLGLNTPAKTNGYTIAELETPMSAMSSYSNYSDTGRAPVGITSMRKMVVPSMHCISSQQNQDQEQDEEAMKGNFAAGTRKLEY